MPNFVPGLEVNRHFFAEEVRPLRAGTFPDVRYAAALLGPGSDVLGFDTAMSMDHDWGPRFDLFLEDGEPPSVRDAIDAMLAERLPREFRGFPTSFTEPDPNDNGTRRLDAVGSGPVRHNIRILTTSSFFMTYLGADVARPIESLDWLTFPSQKLRTVASGAVFHDDIGLDAIRRRLEFYPRDVWLYLLASAWTRIGQEEHLMGRAGFVGDEIGSSLIGARLVRDLMRLCFLMERVYAPYPKWFGTGFRTLLCAPSLSPHLRGALVAESWTERERSLAQAYEIGAKMHNGLGITDPIDANVRPFFGRPFRVIAGERFATAIVAKIEDDSLRQLAARPLIGGIDQFSDSADLVENPEWRPGLRALYE